MRAASSQIRSLLFLIAILALVSCRDQGITDEQSGPRSPELSKGGIPGPPSDLLVPNPPGLSRLPRPLRPGAGPPSFLTNIIDIDAGGVFGCALRSDGVAFCWGSGILGDGSSVGSSVPVEVSGPTRFVRLEAGDLNACGLTTDGEAWCWGDNSQGQLGAGLASAFSLIPVAVAGGHRFTDLDIGLRSMCGVATDGVTYCWGNNSNGQLGIGSAGGPVNTPVSVVNSRTLGLISVETGFQHACGLDASGQLYCWGRANFFGNGSGIATLTPVPTLAAGGATFASVSAGSLHTCGLGASGAATCWGSQVSGELGTGSTNTIALSPALVLGGLSFTTLDASDNNSVIASTCGIETSGAAWCWGSNQSGQLGSPSSDHCTFGTSNYSCSATPVPVNSDRSFRDLAVGLQHACGLDLAGNVWCWGRNTEGQLGNGTMVNSPIPLQVAGLLEPQRDGWIEIAPTSASLNLIGAVQQFTAVAFDENGLPRTIQPTFAWSSSDPDAAIINEAGLATAVATGRITITATASDGLSGRTALTVQIVDPVALFRDAWAGGSSAGMGGSDGVVVVGGLLADEWQHTGTFLTRLEVDRRTIAADNAGIDEAFSRLAFARIALEHDAARLQAANPADARMGELLALAGYTYLAFAENFCSGVPLDDPDTGETTSSLLSLALTRFGEALSGPILPPYDNVARVGIARAQLGLGNFVAAGVAAAAVPTAFTFGTSHSTASGQQNVVWALSPQQKRLSVSDAEGTNGLEFRTLDDPRVPWIFSGLGFDVVSPNYSLLKYPDAAASIIVASGVEARLIEAEAALNAGNVNEMMMHLNGLRADRELPPLAVPNEITLQTDQLFAERAFWMFATGHRLGDLRRLIAHYGRTAASLLPVGAYHKGGSYGSDANLPVPSSARGSGYTGCSDRGS